MPIQEMKLTLFLGDEVDIDLGPPLGANGQATQLDGDVQVGITGEPQNCASLVITPNTHNQKFTIKASTNVTGHADIHVYGDTDLTAAEDNKILLIIRVDVVQNPAVMFRPTVTGPNRPELLPPPRPFVDNPPNPPIP